jgi:Fic family protein
MSNLFAWLNTTELHPLIVSSIFHYEFEFIHPFLDGNGRIGRFWQTLILYKWKNVFEYLPIESLIYENQNKYYEAIEQSTQIASSTPFIEFMLEIILKTFTS